MPEAQPLALLRRNIDSKPEVIRRVLTDAALRKKVLGGVPNDEKKAVKAFALHNAESALKTKPKVRLNLCQRQHSSSRLYLMYCVSCIDLEATLYCSMQTSSWSVGIYCVRTAQVSRQWTSSKSFKLCFILPGDSAPLAEVFDMVVKISCEHLQIMLCPFLLIQQMLVSVAPATAPIFGGASLLKAAKGGN